ncbi:CACTA en-spm transposon protein [Cucumis melo var. makuwa]|uniref:PHD finger protein ALFIN-LIKE n=1 Tax=Cucumis melo var. makuwa TaxID=1194695 RepID=A0A5D3BD81_CUCMM|nr:CACTA en-spm transposon protein [Cucumis melo var. makuwa]
METDDMFLQFEDDLDNIAGGSSSVGDNTGSSSQQTTPTPRRRAQSRLLELERHVAINGRIPMTIGPEVEKPISPHAVRFSQAIGVFVEHQMLPTFKEFRTDCHRHFKKYSDPEEACANPPNALEQSRTNKAARQKQPYNHSSGSKSFLQRQYELAKRRGQSVDHVELFWETHVRAGTFVSQAAEDAHVFIDSSLSTGFYILDLKFRTPFLDMYIGSLMLTEKESLCFYGFPNEVWEVNLPCAEEVPPKLPDPALDINFARDGMQESDWFCKNTLEQLIYIAYSLLFIEV